MTPAPNDPWVRGQGLRALALLVGLASAAVLVAEIAAPRLLARSVGTSIHAWAASIATFLGGLALGNAWGGRLADRYGPRVLQPLACLAALTLLAATHIHAALEGSSLSFGVPGELLALVFTPLCFFVPAVLLGTLPPLAAQAGLKRGIAPGLVLGRLAASNSLGAALGVFVAGYVLVPGFATPTVLLVAALLVAAPALLLLRPGFRAKAGDPAPPPPSTSPTDASTSPATESPSDFSPRSLLWLSALVGAVFLALELAAGRIAVLGLGNSIYTWTAVLGVMLAGAALGAWLGGRYAERHPPRRALASLFVWAVLGVGICLWTPLVMPRLLLPALPWAAQCLLAVTVGFLPAAMALGALGPALARAALADPARHGRTVGGMQAAGTWGAVLAALLCPFLLLPLLGVQTLLLMLTFWLAWTADHLTRTRTLLPLRGVLTLLAVLALVPADGSGGLGDTFAGYGRSFRLREDGPDIHVRESAYYRIRIEPEPTRWCLISTPLDQATLDADAALSRQARFSPARSRLYWTGAAMSSAQYAALLKHLSDPRDGEALASLAQRTHHTVRQMGLDKLTHGFADLEDATWVGYDYELVAAAVWRKVAPATGQRAFFVGGGPYTFQRRLLALDPGARLVTSEIDPEVTRAAREWLGLREDERHVVRHEDARQALPASTPYGGDGYHVIFGDAFNDFSVPFHLTTQEFARDVRARLLPGGVYLVNVVDAFQHGAFLSAMRRTLASVFPHVEVLSLAPREDTQRDTFLLVASNEPISLDPLLDDFERPLPIVRYPASDLDALQARTEAPLLTDAYAPVESLLAPLARNPGR